MATYKRINQLKQTYSIGDNDFLAVDVQNSSETQKIKKTDLLYDYVKDAPSDISTKNWTWARRNKSWYRIYPDEYIFEAPFDGKIYVRINGKWASVEGVNGDMLKSIYDTHGRLTDIFDYTDNAVGIQDNATESLLGAPIIKRGESIEKDFSIKSKLLNFLIDGETNQILYNSILPKSFENKSSLSGIDSFNLIVSGKDLFKYKDISLGSYFNKELTNTLYSLKPTKVNSGEKYTIKNGLKNTFYRFISTNRLNEPDGIYISSFLPIGSEITIPDNVDYIGIECRYGLNINDNIVYQEFEEPLNSYIINTVIPFNEQYREYDITCNSTLYSIDGLVYDYIDLINKKEIHQIEKEEIVYSDEWKVSSIGSSYRTNTIPFELQKGTDNYWNNPSIIYGDSDALNVKTMDEFAISDEESICFYGGKIYIRLSYDRLSLMPGLEDERYLAGLQGFLQENTFNVIYENFGKRLETSIEIEDIQNFDSITNFNCFYSFSFNEETYYGKCFLEIKFDNVVNNLIRKAGDNVYGRLILFGENNLVVNSILGSDGNGSIGGPLFLNKNNNEKVYVNGNNPILDLRDFSTKLDWEPKAKTIEDKEANDKRLVNAEYIHRDYAPLNNPNLTGVPTAPKAQQIGTNQIATGEFIEENYYNKTETDDNYVHAVDGVAKGNLILNETLPKDNENKKLIPNIEFIENYYYDKDKANEKFATLDSPVFIGTPTTPTPNESLPSQIANVDFVNNKYSILKNEINYIPKYKYLSGISVDIGEENSTVGFKVNGFSIQEGTGDTSPSNVREIKNAAELNKVFTFDGTNATFYKTYISSEPNLLVFDVVKRDAVRGSKGFSTWLPMPKGFNEQNGKEGIRAFLTSSGFRICVYKSRLTGETVDAFNTYLKANPLTIVYQSTEDTGEFYTGIEITQGDEYRCEIIGLKDCLHEGDTLETNVQSEYDAYAEFDGSDDENWNVDSGSVAGANGSKRLWIKLSSDNTENTSNNTVATSASNMLLPDTPENTYIAKRDNTFSLIYTVGSNVLHVRIAGISTVEALKTHLQSHPLRVFYKSASGGTGKNVRRETHVKKTLVLTGQENVQADPSWRSGVIAVLQKMADAVQVDGYGTVANITCSHLKVDTPNGIASNGLVACGQGSGNKLFLCFGSQYNTTELAKEYLAQQYAAGTPVTVEYDLAQPEVFVNEPIEIVYNRDKTYTSEGTITPTYFYGTGNGQWPTQDILNSEIIPIIENNYPEPELWNAVTVTAYLRPSDKKRDLLYYYTDGSLGIEAGWYYLYDLSTTINRANGDTAGIVESSKNGDITFIDGDPIVNHSSMADMDKKGNQIDLTYATIKSLNDAIANLQNNLGKSTVYLVKWEE